MLGIWWEQIENLLVVEHIGNMQIKKIIKKLLFAMGSKKIGTFGPP
jgi:hypothetical protein